MTSKVIITIILLIGVASVPSASAHNLLAYYPDNSMFQTAIIIPNPVGSYFTLEEFEREGQSHWYAFVGKEGQQIMISALVPDLPHLRTFFPCFDLLIGQDKVTPIVVNEPFFEEVTGTNWFTKCELSLTLPSDGLYYIRAHDNLHTYHVGDTGKFSLAFGTNENMTVFDWMQVPFWFLLTNHFYENLVYVWIMLSLLFTVAVIVFLILHRRGKP